ncbi:MAG: OmpA family protein [Thiomargarita sp.]|nr:OmpA family protein [Thiomargarita sp.]
MKKVITPIYLILLYSCATTVESPTILDNPPPLKNPSIWQELPPPSPQISPTVLPKQPAFVKIIPKNTERGIVYVFSEAFFKAETANLSPNALKNLDLIVAKYSNRQILIEGHTDNVGNASYNLGLSQRWANSVRFAFIERGIKSNYIVAKGFGINRPIANNYTEPGRQQNRRIEIIIP